MLQVRWLVLKSKARQVVSHDADHRYITCLLI